MKTLLFIAFTALLFGCESPTGSTYFTVNKVQQVDKGIKYTCYKTTPHGWWFARGISLTLHIGINYKTW